MIRRYPFSVFLILVVIIPLFLSSSLHAQDLPKLFTLSDFDLKGHVKSCLVLTNYGKEAYDFNEAGFLTKSVTHYNDQDFDITYYKYQANQLKEKRVENYRENVFDKATSYVNFYVLDSTSGKIISEQIVSYNKDFLGRNDYSYDAQGNLEMIKHLDNEGLDEVVLEYSENETESTVSYLIDDMLQKSVRTSYKKGKDNKDQRIVLTKEFLDGEPQKATEKIFNNEEKLISETKFFGNTKTKKFELEEVSLYRYDDLGRLLETKSKRQDKEVTKSFIYQFDDGDLGNWIKQITIPDNTYITRKISYYPAKEQQE